MFGGGVFNYNMYSKSGKKNKTMTAAIGIGMLNF